MLTGKQKRYLRGLASTEDAIVQLGKAGLTDSTMASLNEALEARELVKIKVLKNSPEEAKEVASLLSEKANAELVQVVGKNIVLYRARKKEPGIILPE